jgi:CMP-N,N'-diacetyllegionaminic acid synthase
MKPSYLAIIPARGGSKRLPNKNILHFCGKPLIRWTIDYALECSFLNKVLVSSDNRDILNLSSIKGVETLKRPNRLSLDKSTTISVILDILKNKKFRNYEYVVLLQPTSPLRTNHHITQAIELLESKKADGIISVSKSKEYPEHMNILPKSLKMDKFIDNKTAFIRTQDLPTYYKLNGAIYIIKTARLIKEETLFLTNNTYAYVMQRESSPDIDDINDFNYAEFLFKMKS